ncbi:YitT family protein [Fredinandcohnia sp. QZ13]|uniref:YitT family protein n=1 Tax=Fredinandcohnia sp. QZ13 TaxID=3073144 RepID=UPI0028535AD9|nr:YitT family protein [Fredinandcohnia sp. QZ13]MDR4889358.1 YitT family protein [Fredinandcohnia sp. QZ13]
MNTLNKSLILGMAALIQGFAMATFLFPHFIPTGGAASVAVLFNYVAGIPFDRTLWILNAGLLFAAIKWLGKGTAIWTLYCVTVTAITIRLVTPFITNPISYVIVDLLVGSIIFGVGIGILFRMGASSGGMDILALIISKLKGYSPGKTLFAINGTILLTTGIVVDWKIIIFALVSQFISTRIIDLINKVNLPTPQAQKQNSTTY